MNRFLHRFNLLGVLLLTALCVVQWRVNRQLHRQLNQGELSRLEQAAKLEHQTRTSSGQANDLASLRAHLTRLTDDLKQSADQLAAAERQLAQAVVERDQLQSAVSNWVSAVAARDERLTQSVAQVKGLAEARNEAVRQFNDLAARHSQLVRDWNNQQSRLKAQAETVPPAR